MNLGSRIKKKREELNLSQEDLAKRLGYKSRSTINKIELGKNDITQHKIVAFAEALNTTPSYLMGWTSEESASKNDAIADIIIKIRTDNELLNIIKDICLLPQDQRTAIQTLLSALNSGNK